MNIQQLRQSLKMKWLGYYEQNRSWLAKMRVWGTYDGLRRPSSGYILATLSVLEPQLEEILAFILDLNNNPDQIVTALGLNFNPDEELYLLQSESSLAIHQVENQSLVQTLPKKQPPQINPDDLENKPLLDLATTKIPSLGKLSIRVEHKLPPLNSPLNHQLTTKTLVIEKPVLGREGQRKSKRSLLMITGIPRRAKTLPTSIIPTKIPHTTTTLPASVLAQTKTLPKLALVTEIAINKQFFQTPIPELSNPVSLVPNSNASTLASWVDEFCQGV